MVISQHITDTINKVGEACEPNDNPCEMRSIMPEGLVSDPICGSDGKSYTNPLALMCAILSEPSEYRQCVSLIKNVVIIAVITSLSELVSQSVQFSD